MGKIQAKEIHCMREEKKDFLVPYGISYCSLTHKRTEESVSLGQMCLEESLLSAEQALAETIMFGNCPYHGALWMGWDDGWQQCLPDVWPAWQRALRVRGWAPVPPLHCSSAWGHQGGSTTAPVPTQWCLGTLDQGCRDNSVHLETV